MRLINRPTLSIFLLDQGIETFIDNILDGNFACNQVLNIVELSRRERLDNLGMHTIIADNTLKRSQLVKRLLKELSLPVTLISCIKT